jgi:hypothetical protein
MPIAPAHAAKARAENARLARFNEGVRANLEPLRQEAQVRIDAASEDGRFEASIRYEFQDLRGEPDERTAEAEQVIRTLIGELESLGYQLVIYAGEGGDKKYRLEHNQGDLTVQITARFQ